MHVKTLQNRRNNRIWRRGLLCKSSTVASSTDQYFSTILEMQVAIINLQTWKATYKIFYNKKNTLAFLPIRLIINGTSLKKCLFSRYDYRWRTHIEYITSKFKKTYNRLVLLPDMQSIRIWAQYCTNRPTTSRAARNESNKTSPEQWSTYHQQYR